MKNNITQKIIEEFQSILSESDKDKQQQLVCQLVLAAPSSNDWLSQEEAFEMLDELSPLSDSSLSSP